MKKVRFEDNQRLDRPDVDDMQKLVEEHFASLCEIVLGRTNVDLKPPTWDDQGNLVLGDNDGETVETGCIGKALGGVTRAPTITGLNASALALTINGVFVDANRRVTLNPPVISMDLTAAINKNMATVYGRIKDTPLTTTTADRVKIVAGVETITSVETRYEDAIETKVAFGKPMPQPDDADGGGWAAICSINDWVNNLPVANTVKPNWLLGFNSTDFMSSSKMTSESKHATVYGLLGHIIETIHFLRFGRNTGTTDPNTGVTVGTYWDGPGVDGFDYTEGGLEIKLAEIYKAASSTIPGRLKINDIPSGNSTYKAEFVFANDTLDSFVQATNTLTDNRKIMIPNRKVDLGDCQASADLVMMASSLTNEHFAESTINNTAIGATTQFGLKSDVEWHRDVLMDHFRGKYVSGGHEKAMQPRFAHHIGFGMGIRRSLDGVDGVAGDIEYNVFDAPSDAEITGSWVSDDNIDSFSSTRKTSQVASISNSHINTGSGNFSDEIPGHWYITFNSRQVLYGCGVVQATIVPWSHIVDGDAGDELGDGSGAGGVVHTYSGGEFPDGAFSISNQHRDDLGVNVSESNGESVYVDYLARLRDPQLHMEDGGSPNVVNNSWEHVRVGEYASGDWCISGRLVKDTGYTSYAAGMWLTVSKKITSIVGAGPGMFGWVEGPGGFPAATNKNYMRLEQRVLLPKAFTISVTTF